MDDPTFEKIRAIVMCHNHACVWTRGAWVRRNAVGGDHDDDDDEHVEDQHDEHHPMPTPVINGVEEMTRSFRST